MKYLSHYTEQAQTELFESIGAFFAFSDKQFDEQKKEGVIYTSLSAGLITPVGTAKLLMEGLEKINQTGIETDIKENGIDKIIERELFNHECFYTGDISDCVDKLTDYPVTEEQVRARYNELYKTIDWDNY
ncbi:MAG: hypothetical protein GY804_03815 [Alphaproteobacteria bacterium]|nr:hypothetical protein [Alphaproteobacteria bacterium]